MNANSPRRHRQHGSALLLTLILLAASMLLGAATAGLSLMNEKAARNGRDRDIAFQAAEAALSDALLDLQQGRGQLSTFPAQAGECGAQGTAQAGLCRSDAAPLWKSPALASRAIAYGSLSGRTFAYGSATLAAQAPRYLIELLQLPDQHPNASAAPLLRYRISALGFGPQPHNRVLLQTIHRIDIRNDQWRDDTPAKLAPGPLLSWREISDPSLQE